MKLHDYQISTSLSNNIILLVKKNELKQTVDNEFDYLLGQNY